MANHGAVAYSQSAADAVELSLLLEWACSVYLNASRLGTPRVLTQDDLDAVVRSLVERKYGTTQKLDREDDE
jgi:L-fuculose-phosphate aldolase